MKEDGGTDGCGGRRDFCLPIMFKNCDTFMWAGYILFQFDTLKNCYFSIPVKLKSQHDLPTVISCSLISLWPIHYVQAYVWLMKNMISLSCVEICPVMLVILLGYISTVVQIYPDLHNIFDPKKHKVMQKLNFLYRLVFKMGVIFLRGVFSDELYYCDCFWLFKS
jgi:hypothetical protein